MGMAIRIALVALTIQLLIAGVAQAQDFGTLVVQAAAANQQFVDGIKAAAQATDLASLRQGTAGAITSGKSAQSLLQEALAIAPNDAARSRVQGVLTHLNDSLLSAAQVAQRATIDAARASLDAARGEAVEALSELAPFAATLVPITSTTLPATGGMPVGVLLGCGFCILTLGLGLRRVAYS
jgi:hypothetical protein